MRALLLAMLGACEFQPPPRQAPAPVAATVADKPAPALADAGAIDGVPGPAPEAASTECTQAAVHIAQVLIDSTTDPANRATYEQARTKVVRATAEACSSQRWSADALQCFLDTKTDTDVRACEKKFPPPGFVPPPPPGHPKEG